MLLERLLGVYTSALSLDGRNGPTGPCLRKAAMGPDRCFGPTEPHLTMGGLILSSSGDVGSHSSVGSPISESGAGGNAYFERYGSCLWERLYRKMWQLFVGTPIS
jgi:hypothetical protein